MDTPQSSSISDLLGDYTTLEYILIGDLRDAIEEPPTVETRRWLTAILDALLETLPRELELQEEGGYLAEVIEQYPNWADQVEQLYQEHQSLHQSLCELRRHLDGQLPLELVIERVRRELRDWMNRIVAHHRHERRLVQTAFNLEVGGES